MTFLRIARNLLGTSSLQQHRLLPALTMPEKIAVTRNLSQTVDKSLYNGCQKLVCTWYRPLGFIAKRSFVTTDLLLAKDRGKEKKKPTKVQINMNELSELINVNKLVTQLEETLTGLKENYAKNLTLRSALGSLEQIPVMWDGKEYQLQELSEIARKPKTVVINVAAFPQVIPSIIQAIAKSGMNLNPQQDGTTLFVPIPKVTKEHRENLAKNAKTLFIGCRDDLKDIQLRFIKSLKNKTHVSADDVQRAQNQIQALTTKFVDEAEAIFKMKQKELLGDSD